MAVELSAESAAAATVLVVEDDALIRMDAAQELRSAGYNVIEACDADEALAVLEARIGVDVLLTDVNMPGSRDGLALARIVRRQLPHARIIVMSANRYAWEGGLVDASVMKPYTVPELLAAVAALLAVDRSGT
jgi:two-component system, response regulator PdtaR